MFWVKCHVLESFRYVSDLYVLLGMIRSQVYIICDLLIACLEVTVIGFLEVNVSLYVAEDSDTL